MKTNRLSRSAEDRNGHREMAVRGRASLSRGALYDPDVVLTARRFRRANRLTHAEAAMLDVTVRRPDGTAIRPTVTLEMDERTRLITGWRTTT